MNIDVMVERAEAFRPRLAEVKTRHPEIDWFFGDTLGNVRAFAGLLSTPRRNFFSEIIPGRIADIGAADGDLSFFFESLGCQCDLIDFSSTNYNKLTAVRCLREALQSRVEILERDLDSQFQLDGQYDVVFALGLIYHLKNPFYFLETISKHSHYCFLSTRVARWTHSGRWPWQWRRNIHQLPIAFLLGEQECNNDATNYWIFSHAGLKRLVERSGWRILDQVSWGDRWRSNPRDHQHDERAHLLLESLHRNPAA